MTSVALRHLLVRCDLPVPGGPSVKSIRFTLVSSGSRWWLRVLPKALHTLVVKQTNSASCCSFMPLSYSSYRHEPRSTAGKLSRQLPLLILLQTGLCWKAPISRNSAASGQLGKRPKASHSLLAVIKEPAGTSHHSLLGSRALLQACRAGSSNHSRLMSTGGTGKHAFGQDSCGVGGCLSRPQYASEVASCWPVPVLSNTVSSNMEA